MLLTSTSAISHTTTVVMSKFIVIEVTVQKKPRDMLKVIVYVALLQENKILINKGSVKQVKTQK